MTEIVTIDIGGTHARFAIAEVEGGRVLSLSEPVKLKTAEHASLQMAKQTYGRMIGRPLPRAAGIAIASPIGGEVIKLTNNPWVFRPALINERLDVDNWTLINDFGAVGHAVAQLSDDHFIHVCGPDKSLPEAGSITVCGPGTGLGVAQVFRHDGGYSIIETEGGHMDFSPLDPIEDEILKTLRKSYTRVALGTVAGNLALAHGPKGGVLAGGLGFRLKDRLLQSGFEDRFVAKGRFQSLMKSIPVKLITHPEPGLFGAAAAYAQEHTQ